MNKCPWPDFAGADIHEGDVIAHPSGETGKVLFLSQHSDPHDQWRVLYFDDPCQSPSRLCLQIGDKGMAVVVGRDVMPKFMRLAGRVIIRDDGESPDVLFCGDENVAEWAEQFTGTQISLRYWIADREEPDDAIKQRAVERIVGLVDAEWDVHYSEVTGYLWTDSGFKVGGHDMLDRLSQVGQYLLLEVEVHEDVT